jgi:LacI family transcriptional regulator
MSQTPISQKQIAEALGTTQATVSMALAGNPKITLKLREKVQEMAEKMGYRPDPGLRALSQYRRQKSPQFFHATLAWLHNQGSVTWWKESAVYRLMYDAVSEQASKLGYRLENFWIEPGAMTPQRATDILRNRSIKGILLLPTFRKAPRIELDWSHFAVVRLLDAEQGDPNMHWVGSDHYAAAVQSIQEVIQRGYRRPGLITSPLLEAANAHQYASAYLGMQHQLGGKKWPPVHYVDSFNPAGLSDWLTTHKPDVILCAYLEAELDKILATLRAHKSVPKELGVLMLCQPDSTRKHRHGLNLSGFDEDFADIGRRAANLLVNLIEHFDVGLCDRPIRHLVAPKWVEGETLNSR